MLFPEVSILFRGINAAASLKPGPNVAVVGEGLELFRGINAAASLKPALSLALFRRGKKPLPRHQRRGLIEASERSGGRSEHGTLPRHQRRGLIEAATGKRKANG